MLSCSTLGKPSIRQHSNENLWLGHYTRNSTMSDTGSDKCLPGHCSGFDHPVDSRHYLRLLVEVAVPKDTNDIEVNNSKLLNARMAEEDKIETSLRTFSGCEWIRPRIYFRRLCFEITTIWLD